jgi:hypothetical protein
MPALTLQSAPHSVVLLLQSLPHRQLGSGTIAVGRGRRNVPLLFEARPQLLVAAAHVLSQNMSAAGFILRQVAPGAVRRPGIGRAARRPGRVLSRRLTSGEHKKADSQQTASRLSPAFHKAQSSSNRKPQQLF